MTVVLEEGKPYFWKSAAYGIMAVHFTGFSPNGKVANITIDGGEASKQAQQFPEMSDGVYFVMPHQLSKRPARVRNPKASAERHNPLNPGGTVISDTLKTTPRKPRGRAGEIRRQAEIGKTRPVPTAEERAKIVEDNTPIKNTAGEKTRRLSLNAALKEARVVADTDPKFWWPFNIEDVEEETF